MKTRSPGLALIIVVGVLGILAALAVAFTILAQFERRASQHRLYATKATLLARSGIEDALARISAGQDASLRNTRYQGEDYDADGLLDAGVETAEQLFNPSALDADTCPIRQALRPSFFVNDKTGPGAPPVLRAAGGGRSRGYSGRLAGDRTALGNTYALKVEDESAKINVNGGFLDAGDRDQDGIPDHRDPVVGKDEVGDYDENWEYYIISPAAPYVGWNRELTRVLDVLGAQSGVGVSGLGTMLISNRPEDGYESMDQVHAALGLPPTRDLSPYLTTRSWVDTKVVRPGVEPPSFEECGRPPVNLNAATRPVLQALIEGLRKNSTTISSSVASSIVQSIMAQRPFEAWADFGAFCDGLVPSVLSSFAGSLYSNGGDLQVADMLKANFDPNTRVTKRGSPDQLLWRWTEKLDLAVWSTEGSLGPTGTFRISVCARLTGPDGRLLAEARRTALVEVFSLLRQTTQKDFVGGRTSLAEYLSLSTNTDPAAPTTGASAGNSWWGGAPPGVGVAAITYPCPPTAIFAGNADSFDGCIGLATVDLAPSWFCPSVRFLHHFDDSWNADVATTDINPQPDALSADLQQDVTVSTFEFNTLCPDGGHLQAGRIPAFYVDGNFPPSTVSGDPPSNHAVFSYWAKASAFATGLGQPFGSVNCVRKAGGYTQNLTIGSMNDLWGISVEKRAASSDISLERLAYVLFSQSSDISDAGSHTDFNKGRTLCPGQRWVLVTAHFDTDETVTNRDVGIRVSGLRTGIPIQQPLSYTLPYDTSLTEDLVAPGQLFTLGTSTGGYAEVTVDELAICDFGDNAAAAMSAYGLKHSDRYKIGRYYKLNDAAFLSARLTPAGGSPVRLLRASWTAYLPEESRQEILSRYSVTVAGSPRAIDPILQKSRLEVELLDASATLGSAPVPPLLQGGTLAEVRDGFRYRVTFKPDPIDPLTGASDPANQPVLESPWFDDITFAWQRADGPRVLAWGAGK